MTTCNLVIFLVIKEKTGQMSYFCFDLVFLASFSF